MWWWLGAAKATPHWGVPGGLCQGDPSSWQCPRPALEQRGGKPPLAEEWPRTQPLQPCITGDSHPSHSAPCWGTPG